MFPIKDKNNEISNGEVKEEKSIPAAEGVTGFIEFLINKKVVNREVIQKATKLKQSLDVSDKRPLYKLLIDEFNIEREKIYEHFVSYYSFRVVHLKDIVNQQNVFSFITKIMTSLPFQAREKVLAAKVLPFQVSESDPSKLIIVTPDPGYADISVIARSFPYAKTEIAYIPLENFQELMHKLNLNKRDYSNVPEQIEEEDTAVFEELDEEIRKGHLAELIDNLFNDAVKMGASDIHIIPKGVRSTEFHIRIDGKLTLWHTTEDIRAEAISAVIKDRAGNLDRFERNMAQDGFAQKTIDGKLIRFRLSVIPITGRELRQKIESIVIRVLRDPEQNITVDNIGFDSVSLERFKKAISKPYGVIILTGPTGSGKSTTLLAAIRAVLNPAINVITVEDPVEYLIEGARQVKLNPKLEFEGALRAILRHDPDVVMVGEIRDKITADVAIKLANTGHLTFSTLHTNDAPSAIARLYKMGIEPFLLAYSINIIVAQRLVRKLCPRCKQIDTEIELNHLVKIGLPKDDIQDFKFYRPNGCIHCIKGYKGRTAIHEALYFTKEIRQIIMDSGSSINEESIRDIAIKQGMRTLRQAGIELLKNGVTSIEEIVATTADD